MTIISPTKTLQAVAAALPGAALQELGVTDITMPSPRTVKMAIKQTVAGINCIKVTLQENGELRVRTYQIEEVEDVANIAPDKALSAIKALISTSPMSALDPMTLPDSITKGE